MPLWEDVDLAQLAKSYFAEIGVVTNIEVESNEGAWVERVSGKNAPMYSLGCRHANHDPIAALRGRFYSGGDPNGAWGNGLIDLTYDAIVDKIATATDRKDMLRAAREQDMYYVDQMWGLMLPPVSTKLKIHQPWLKDYRGEQATNEQTTWVLPYLWIDQEMKKEMGH